MALRGILQSFPPSELLQFLAHTNKTGVLRVYDEEDSKFTAFHNGQLVYSVHQRVVPHLSELVLRRGLTTQDELNRKRKEQSGWDDLVSRALARKRLLPRQRRRFLHHLGEEGNLRLTTLLVAQGRLSEADLEHALAPEGVPDNLLEEVLREAGLIQSAELRDIRSSIDRGETLLKCLLDHGLLTNHDITLALTLAPDELVSEMLIAKSVMTQSDVRESLNQLRTLRGGGAPTVRLGEYLVATGQVTQRQFEAALEEQLSHDKRLGEILIDQGHITAHEILRSIEEIDSLRVDFGPLYPLRKRLQEECDLPTRAFAAALEEHKKTGRSLSDVLLGHNKVTDKQFISAVKKVLVEEMCDLLSWSHASFEFVEEIGLEDVLNSGEFARVHSSAYEVQSLLLEAHSTLDEWRRTKRGWLSLMGVYVATSEDDEKLPNPLYRNALQSFANPSSLREIRRVLPGNRFSHLQLFADLLSQSYIRPLTRREASLRGKNSLTQQSYGEALTLFRHALRSPGEKPPDAELEKAIETTRTALEGSALRRGFRVIRLFFGALGKPKAEGSRVPRITPEPAYSRMGREKNRAMSIRRLALEQAMNRSGWVRRFWSFQARLLHLIERHLPTTSKVPRSVFVGATSILAVVLLLAFWPETRTERITIVQAATRSGPRNIQSTMISFQADAPAEAPPTIDGDRIILAARDGKLRALRSALLAPDAGDDALELLWELDVGEFGDLLSQPTVVGEQIFVTNVRGWVYAVDHGGERILWKKRFPRLESLTPVPLVRKSSKLAGVAICSREKVYVLGPDDGAILYELQTGNRIVAAPVGNADVLFVGSSDNHVYAVSWRDQEFLWDHEESDDLVALAHGDSVVAFATRDGRLGALDSATGKELWKRVFDRNSIRGLAPGAPGAIHVRFLGGSFEEMAISTGNTVASFAPARGLNATAGRFDRDRFFYVTRGGYVGQVDPRSGEPRWQLSQLVGRVTGWAPSKDVLAVTTKEGKLTLISLNFEEELPVATYESPEN